MNKEFTEYPEAVEEILEKVEAILLDGHFFEDFEIENDYGHLAFREAVGPLYFESWLGGDVTEVSPEKMEEALQKVPVIAGLMKLKDVGLIDSVENEEGEEVFFITSNGKKLHKKWEDAVQ